MGAAGTDTAIETADIALMKDDLSKVAEAVHLGRQTLRIIQTNIIFALAVKALFLSLRSLVVRAFGWRFLLILEPRYW
jgi:Zn2+/Cd2+-exporting ATPase